MKLTDICQNMTPYKVKLESLKFEDVPFLRLANLLHEELMKNLGKRWRNIEKEKCFVKTMNFI